MPPSYAEGLPSGAVFVGDHIQAKPLPLYLGGNRRGDYRGHFHHPSAFQAALADGVEPKTDNRYRGLDSKAGGRKPATTSSSSLAISDTWPLDIPVRFKTRTNPSTRLVDTPRT
jgi:hypothetical protein